MGDQHDTIEELRQALREEQVARQAAEEERDAALDALEAFRQVMWVWDAVLELIRESQRGGRQPLPCHMAARSCMMQP